VEGSLRNYLTTFCTLLSTLLTYLNGSLFYHKICFLTKQVRNMLGWIALLYIVGFVFSFLYIFFEMLEGIDILVRKALMVSLIWPLFWLSILTILVFDINPPTGVPTSKNR